MTLKGKVIEVRGIKVKVYLLIISFVIYSMIGFTMGIKKKRSKGIYIQNKLYNIFFAFSPLIVISIPWSDVVNLDFKIANLLLSLIVVIVFGLATIYQLLKKYKEQEVIVYGIF